MGSPAAEVDAVVICFMLKPGTKIKASFWVDSRISEVITSDRNITENCFVDNHELLSAMERVSLGQSLCVERCFPLAPEISEGRHQANVLTKSHRLIPIDLFPLLISELSGGFPDDQFVSSCLMKPLIDKLSKTPGDTPWKRALSSITEVRELSFRKKTSLIMDELSNAREEMKSVVSKVRAICSDLEKPRAMRRFNIHSPKHTIARCPPGIKISGGKKNISSEKKRPKMTSKRKRRLVLGNSFTCRQLVSAIMGTKDFYKSANTERKMALR